MLSNTCLRDKVDSSKHFCNIFIDSVAVIPLEYKILSKLAVKFIFHGKYQQTTSSRPKQAEEIKLDQMVYVISYVIFIYIILCTLKYIIFYKFCTEICM